MKNGYFHIKIVWNLNSLKILLLLWLAVYLKWLSTISSIPVYSIFFSQTSILTHQVQHDYTTNEIYSVHYFYTMSLWFKLSM